MTITITIENGEHFFDVELEAELTKQNDGIGSYEYWGQKCYDRGEDYYIMEDYPTWNHDLYTYSENWLIAIWLMANYSWVEDLFIKEFEKQLEL